MTGALLRGILAGLAIAAAVLAAFYAVRGAPHSPNCPPGQWWVEKPGSGWMCASDPGPGPGVFTPPPARPRPAPALTRQETAA